MDGRSLVVRAAVAVLAMAPTAHALDKRACVDASDKGQQERDRGHLQAARKDLVACADASCPNAVRAACAEWLEALDRAMPSLVLGANTAGNACTAPRDLVDVRVTIDGQPLVLKLDGRPVEVDPGQHALHFEAEGASSDETLVVREGDKARSVKTTLHAPEPACSGVSGGTSPGPAPLPPPVSASASTGAPASAFVFGGVAVAALGVFGGFGLVGHFEYESLSSSCGHACSPEQADSVNTKFIVADVALGVGVAAAIVSTVLFLLPHHTKPRTTALLTF